MLMHCSRLLRCGALCALLLVVALISSSLVLDLESIPPMQQFFRVIRGQSSALDDVSDSSAVPVFASVSSAMSADPAGDSADGRSAAASLTFARQIVLFCFVWLATLGVPVVAPGTAADTFRRVVETP